MGRRITVDAVMRRLADIAIGSPNETAAIAAAQVILDRSYGKANQTSIGTPRFSMARNGYFSTVPAPELSRLSSELKNLQAERQKRLRARNHLLTFASSIEIPTAPHSIDEDSDREEFTPNTAAFAKHHLLWLDCLQKIEDGKIKRLMGFMPPGSAESIHSSVVFPDPRSWQVPKEFDHCCKLWKRPAA